MENYILVFVAGLLVGTAELLSRHRDYPLRAISSGPSIGYLALNGGLSVAALWVVKLSPPAFLMSADGAGLDPVKTALVVGFGAAAFFRSSFFKVRGPEGDISVGFGLIIEVFQRVIDGEVDRKLGERRIDDVSTIMANVSFVKAAKALPTYCFAALRRVSIDEQQQLAIQIKALSDATDLDEDAKVVSLGLAIMALTGKQVLSKAVSHLGNRIAR